MPEKQARRVSYSYDSRREQEAHGLHQVRVTQSDPCDGIYSDIYDDDGVLVAAEDRPEFSRMLKTLSPGDTIVVYSLTHLERSLRTLVPLLCRLEQRKLYVYSMSEAFNTKLPSAKSVFWLLESLAKCEQTDAGNRVRAGVQRVKQAGQHCGRKPVSRSEILARAEAFKRHRAAGLTSVQAAQAAGMTLATAKRACALAKAFGIPEQ